MPGLAERAARPRPCAACSAAPRCCVIPGEDPSPCQAFPSAETAVLCWAAWAATGPCPATVATPVALPSNSPTIPSVQTARLGRQVQPPQCCCSLDCRWGCPKVRGASPPQEIVCSTEGGRASGHCSIQAEQGRGTGTTPLRHNQCCAKSGGPGLTLEAVALCRRDILRIAGQAIRPLAAQDAHAAEGSNSHPPPAAAHTTQDDLHSAGCKPNLRSRSSRR